MEIITELDQKKDLSLALGFFDGVHSGHRKVIASAGDFAKKNNTKSAVITFKEHPCCTLWNLKPKYILQKEKRIEFIKNLGVDYLYLLDFEKIKHYTGEEYLKEVIMYNFAPKCIVTGFNHYFGVNKSGDTELLNKYANLYNYTYEKIQPVEIENEIISSTAIRNYLKFGEIEKANKMLERKFSLTGSVIEGNKIGRTIGFPTANLVYPEELVELPYGCYKTETLVDGKLYKSITNFGIKPTLKHNTTTIAETHIIDFDKDLYGKSLEIRFDKFIRKEQKFNSLNELKEQIKTDLKSLK